ncbi:HNH endonuclease signature motif containing protein [Massilia sp. X63]|uniref:HNH endonuclease signature motif containing protein n=1 Tax=Massilia sp. X63 TaxID=3237285 RepID=UPI0034DDA138
MTLPTLERVKELLEYDFKSGLFKWKKVTSNRAVLGAEAGWFHQASGYRIISIDGEKIRSHRLAWFYMTGAWPPDQIDHINGVRDDNRWCNLRPATDAQNAQNKRHAKSDNHSSGLLGVSRNDKRFRPWRAHLTLSGKYYHLGNYETKEEAHEAYLKAKRKMHPNCTI